MDTTVGNIVNARIGPARALRETAGPGEGPAGSHARAKQPGERDNQAFRWLVLALLLELLFIFSYAYQFPAWAEKSSVASVAALLAAAAAAVGVGIGFLFGLPHALSEKELGTGAASSVGQESATIAFTPNTNLDQISDWLTKVLVGVGLTQIGSLREGWASLSSFAASALGAGPRAEVLAAAILAYSAVAGFLFGFLWARLIVIGQMTKTDQSIRITVASLWQSVTRSEKLAKEEREQGMRDTEALRLVTAVLSPEMPGTPTVSQAELDSAVARSSPKARIDIFTRALSTTQEHYESDQHRWRLGLAIMVYRALIAADPSEHQNHAQLAFALANRQSPDFAEAEREYDLAIDMRNAQGLADYLIYELGRSVARMGRDLGSHDERSPQDRKEQILGDLRMGCQGNKGLKEWILRRPTLIRWVQVNDMSDDALFACTPEARTEQATGAH